MKIINLAKNKEKLLVGGFTILEMVVAIGIFSIVITIAVTFFNQSLQGQRRVLSSQTIQDNLRYAIEFMSREIRMGSSGFILGTQSIAPPPGFSQSNSLNFINSNGDSITYLWDTNLNSPTYHSILRTKNGQSQQITSQSVDITNFSFWLSQSSQSQITMLLKAQLKGAVKPEEQIPITVQTTISPRTLQ